MLKWPTPFKIKASKILRENINLMASSTLEEISMATINQIKMVVSMFCMVPIVNFSGGKDSIVLLDLVRKSGVKHVPVMNLTTVDPPEMIYFVRKNYPEVKIKRPEKTMWQLILQRGWPPTRRIHYCCQYLKERPIKGLSLTGIRAEESMKRRDRTMLQALSKERILYHPILYWKEIDVWGYIETNKLKYPSVYDDGFIRVGCIGCPMTGKPRRELEFKLYPKYKETYLRIFQKCVDKIRNETKYDKFFKKNKKWKTGQEMFDWWLNQ